MRTVSHDTIEELRRFRRQATKGFRDRIQMVILAMEGRTAPEIAAALGSSRRTVQDWVYRYNRLGRDGLVDRRGGNHRHLNADQERQVREHLDRTAADPHDGIRRGEDLRQWIHQHFGVLYTLTGVYELLHRLGYSCLMPRPRHAQSDPQAQEEFKKKRLRQWRRSPRPTRRSALKSGGRMRRASASKGR